MSAVAVSPDCAAGKCGACVGAAWDEAAGVEVDCPHPCHTPASLLAPWAGSPAAGSLAPDPFSPPPPPHPRDTPPVGTFPTLDLDGRRVIVVAPFFRWASDWAARNGAHNWRYARDEGDLTGLDPAGHRVLILGFPAGARARGMDAALQAAAAKGVHIDPTTAPQAPAGPGGARGLQ